MKIDILETLKSFLEQLSSRVKFWKIKNLTKYKLLESHMRIWLFCTLEVGQKQDKNPS